jgi:HlyD family secretion protein
MNNPLETRSSLRQGPPPLSHAVPASYRRWTGGLVRWLIIALLLLIVAAAGTAWWRIHGTPAVHYLTAPVTRGNVVRAVTATGTVNPELTIIVGSYVSGVIQQLYCDYNTKVEAGQICAKIDPRPYQMVVNQAKANLAVAVAQLEKDKANLVYARLSYERTRTLVGRQYASQDATDNAKNLYDQAQAQIGLDQAAIQQRQAELDAANVNLGYTDIVSPVDGTVVSRNVTQGQTVAASFQTPTLFLIATDLTKMQVDTNISESDIGGIKEGDKATFSVDAFPNRVFQGTVTQVRQSPQTVQNVVTFDAVVGVDNSDLALKPGMTASTRIIVERRDDVLRVPNQALRYVPGGLLNAMTSGTTGRPDAVGTPTNANLGENVRLWVLRNGQAVPLDVLPGLDDDNFTEIVKGDLHPGDQIVIGEESGSSSGQAALPSPRL